MKTIEVVKYELIDILKANRAAHKKEYEEAIPVYEQLVRDKIAELAELGDKKKLNIDKINRQSYEVAGVRAPKDYSDSYDRAISMLDMEVRDTVTLSVDEFRNYVEDEWSWSSEIVGSNKLYSTLSN